MPTAEVEVALGRFVAAVEAEGLGVYGVHLRRGEETASHRWRSDDRENLYWVSKGVCALATGIAIDEGLLTLDTGVGDGLPGLDLGPGVAEVTMRHLLSMTSGIDFRWFEHEPVVWPDLAAEMLSRPSVGRRFQYSDASTYVAMRMLGAIVGDVRDWLLPRLFDPLEIDNPPPMDRYGLATWAGPGDAWRLEGRYGQFVVVLDDAVATVTAHEEAGEDRIAELAVEVLTGN